VSEFDIICADPPWRTEFGRTDSRSAERHYATMSLADIVAVFPRHVVAKDALLYLWCPASMLYAGLSVMEGWGFRYRTSAVWCKPSIGIGQWFRQQHELILLGRRGRFPTPPRNAKPSSVLHAERRRHSEKPEELQDAIERAYPGRRYLELFARRQRPGWTCWGDQMPAATFDAEAPVDTLLPDEATA
jgi:N6-adenosine-specific RNA methylase IME4